jgi:hypothetical protein
MICCAAGMAGAQTASPRFHVRGRVVDPLGSAVSGAQLTMAGAPAAVTGKSGRFDLGEMSPGRYALEVRRIGFQPQSQQIGVLDRDVDLLIELKSSAVILDTVKTSALRQRLPRLFERMDQHLGRVAFGDSLRLKYPNASVTDLLKFDKGLVQMLAEPKSKDPRHDCGKMAFVDGHRVQGSLTDVSKIPYGLRYLPLGTTHNSDSLGIQEVVSARDVAAIEVFQSPNYVNERFIPAVGELEGPLECTRIILIWTNYYKMHPHPG